MALAVGVMEAVQEGRWVAHAAPGKGEQLHVPVRIAGAALEFYQQYAGVDMPPALPVFQAVAVPGMTWCVGVWGGGKGREMVVFGGVVVYTTYAFL